MKIKYLLLFVLTLVLTGLVQAQNPPNITPGATVNLASAIPANNGANFPNQVFLKAPNGDVYIAETGYRAFNFVVNHDGSQATGGSIDIPAYYAPQIPLGVYEVSLPSSGGKQIMLGSKMVNGKMVGGTPINTNASINAPSDSLIVFPVKIVPRLAAPVPQFSALSGTDITVQVQMVGPTSYTKKDNNGYQVVDVRIPVTLTSDNPGAAAITGSNVVTTDETGWARFTVHTNVGGSANFTATSPGFESAQVKVVSVDVPPAAKQPSAISQQLQPGDVLLYKGTVPIVSQAIMDAEKSQLGSAPYSHTGVYVGELNGVPMVAEMLSGGYSLTPLAVSIDDSTVVDAYRYRGITPQQQQAVAANASGYSLLRLRYAYEQIGVLGLISKAWTGAPMDETARVADKTVGGKKSMICSELVRWAYTDAGIPLQVTPWKDTVADGVWTTNDRQHDYTTPNMVARSPNLQMVFKVK